ncbi:inorganic diphosphatase [Vreelandella utahensis]|uniref:inorganic diphosphatase n=1 Tax=Vreelandella halophila TaxID=86177 RepID=UPI0015C3929B|nr:inorganic diphosphatase [Halomonas utahensis]
MAAASSATASAATDTIPHPYQLAQPEEAPARLLALVEIPAGSSIKYEVDKQTGHVIVDRFLKTPVAYPANYGSLPSVFAKDGDPIDILVFTRASVTPGAAIEVRPIGTLRMSDEGEADNKIIAVPAADVDPFFGDVHSIEDLPDESRASIEAFFRNYRSNDPSSEKVTTDGFRDAKATTKALKRLLNNSHSK